MKVAELKALLEDFNDNDMVIISDAEGNIFSRLNEATSGFYFFEEGWAGDFVSQTDAEADEDIDISEGAPAICLWPE